MLMVPIAFVTYVGVTHVAGYYGMRFLWTYYTSAAMVEGAVLALLAGVSYRIASGGGLRRGRDMG